MIHKENISPQEISWVKSDNYRLQRQKSIKNLYYPETTAELLELVNRIRLAGEDYDIIGHSSNTLFLPSYNVIHLICTKKLNSYVETDDLIICDCGVSISVLSKHMVPKGYKGFEGLSDLPGTIAAAVYGNCGCRGCSVNELIHHIEFMNEDGSICDLTKEDLKLEYRSTILKRGILKGVILKVYLKKNKGNADELLAKAEYNHKVRIMQQPNGINNLGTTFNGGSSPTLKGLLFRILLIIVSIFIGSKDSRKVYPCSLKLIGKGKFAPYTYRWNRYMFLDEKSHLIFNEYFIFLQKIYKDVRLEIEIKK